MSDSILPPRISITDPRRLHALRSQVLGIGLFFSALMVGLTWLQNRYSPDKTSSASEFTSASHSVRPGLISAGIVSAWTWAATLLQSSAMAYKVGISGSYW